MKSIEILSLGLRLVGIYGILKGVQFIVLAYGSIQQITYTMEDESFIGWYLTFGFSVAVYFMVVYFLISKPTRVATKLLPASQDKDPIFKGSAQDIQIAGFTIIGVYILSYSVPELLRAIVLLWHASGETAFYGQNSQSQFLTELVVTLVQVCIGIYLCLQASGLSHLLYKIRG
ncbi:hypothetical protein [Gilvimarinus agarilyticus]|uniref:hypothetical protein n=1 Tax=Gilvimarinus agarilyticus TaxID=679259 RepID=UPI0005A29958|nr:hypothetical protein [Gilvimarinus agarilyticus]